MLQMTDRDSSRQMKAELDEDAPENEALRANIDQILHGSWETDSLTVAAESRYLTVVRLRSGLGLHCQTEAEIV